MCGLVGSYHIPFADIEAGLDRIKHRGPDGRGIVEDGETIHGHVRLAVLDLTSASDQPFRYRGAVLSFNGEIWNFRELRTELAAAGYEFRTTGDTEVLAAALDRWGVPAALPRLEGMFAFAWSRGSEAWLVRDRFGKIPLYVYRQQDGGFLWTSERKAFPRLWLTPLAPGDALNLATCQLVHWYKLPMARSGAPTDIGRLLEAGVERRMVADAPLCCLLSGGLDSSTIATIAKRRKRDLVAFTAALDGQPSKDLEAAKRVAAALEMRLEVIRVRPPTSDDLERAAFAIEVPSKAQIEIATLCIPLAEAIRANGFKVVLSGEAADELFGGYGSMIIKGYRADDLEWRWLRVQQVQKMARGNFVRCNKVFMAHGVECRLPFMDRALVECVINLGKDECPPGKDLLKAHARRIGVADQIVRRTKETFQGGAGTDAAAARAVASPRTFYRRVVENHFGMSAVS